MGGSYFHMRDCRVSCFLSFFLLLFSSFPCSSHSFVRSLARSSYHITLHPRPVKDGEIVARTGQDRAKLGLG